MRIGFLLLRDTFFKTMGSLIAASTQRGHHVILLYDEGAVWGAKAYQRVTKDKLLIFEEMGAEAVKFQMNDLATVGLKHQLDMLVTHEGFYFLQDQLEQVQQLRETGTRVVSLAHFFENIRAPLASLEQFDKTFYLSQFAVDTHFLLDGGANTKEPRQRVSMRYEISGSPMFDQLGDLDPETARLHYGIPADKKVVLFFAPVIVEETRWRFYLWADKNKLKRVLRIVREGKWGYLLEALSAPTLYEITRAIREFCDRNDAFLIVKSRAKQRDPEYLKKSADLYLAGTEDSYYPVFTSYELLAAADLCINVMSMSIVEGVAADVPVINIHIPHQEYQPPSPNFYTHEQAYFDAVMNIERAGPFTCAGCINNIDRHDIISWLKDKNLNEILFDQGAAERYKGHYLGITEESSSDRILGSLEKMGTQVELGRVRP